ncbi:hypothetical protein SKAU_G00166410 [Synaphobranchus kaupii]|uniref:Uncharacterized protein n=1 Tax=Synaphobranchus kaupii TaxID=118154 RepID=A0A9Q1FJP0_SYNKA|nr:hypothetical protein SKAU_G00166410 [Synaphobranchus kaupii]
MPELPDLSHLTEEERKIIMAVMVRQKEEEEKEEAMLKEEKPIQARTVHLLGKKPPAQNDISQLHQQFETYKDQVQRIGEDPRRQQGQHKDDAPTCGICHKTKFADGCGHLCSYCQTKFCARCGGRVSLRANNVMWVCNLCRKQQEILTKSGEWFPGRGGKPSGLGTAVSDPTMCADADGDKKARSRSQVPLGSTPITQDGPQTAPTDRGKGPDPGKTDTPTLRSRSEPPRERKRPLSVPDQCGLLGLQRERQRASGKLQSQASDDPGERRENRRLMKRRREERYRSDPNLPRYPGKPPPEEQDRLGRGKAPGAPGEGEPRAQPENRQSRRGVEGERNAPLENHGSYSADRTVGGGGVQGAPPLKLKQNQNKDPQTPAPQAGPAAHPPDLREPPDLDEESAEPPGSQLGGPSARPQGAPGLDEESAEPPGSQLGGPPPQDQAREDGEHAAQRFSQLRPIGIAAPTPAPPIQDQARDQQETDVRQQLGGGGWLHARIQQLRGRGDRERQRER